MRKALICIVVMITPAMTKAQNKFESHIEIKEKIVFEERDGIFLNPDISWVYNVSKDAKILDTNLQGHNVTVYDSSGKVVNRFGRRGKGPGDFEFPMSTIELEDRTFLVSEYSGKMSQFTNNGDSLLTTFNTSITPLSNILEIDSDRILLMGNKVGSNQSNSLLHIYNRSKSEIEKSFLELPFEHGDYAQIFRMSVQLAVGSIYGNKILAAVIPYQKLYVFSSDGVLEDTFEVDLNNFIEIEKNSKSLSTEEIFSYMTSFSKIERLFHLKDGSFLIQYSTILEINASNPADRLTEYNLAFFNSDRELVFEIKDGPELLGIDRESANLYFRGLDEDPTYLIKGKIKN